jgi:hypothetical protein
MRRHSASVITASVLALAAGAVPAGAQNFMNGSAETIWSGNIRLSGSPAHMFGRDGAPDNTGGAFRVGYGISDSFDLEAKSAFFDGVTLLGGDGHLRVFDGGDTLVSVTLGGHQALVKNGLDSTALDLAAALSRRLSSRLQVYGGAAFSWERGSGVPEGRDADFTRVHLVPGLKVGLADRLDLLLESGLGLNDDSPHYVAAGLALHLPASDRAAGRRR